jgi:hypothetical protein
LFRHQVVSGPGLAIAGNLTAGSAVVVGITATAGVLPGSIVTGPGLPPDTLVLSVDSASQITLSQSATAAGTAVGLAVGNEPVTLAQAKQHARVERTDEDARVASFIVAARRTVEVLLGQFLIATTADYWGDNWPWLGGYYNRVVRAQAVMGPIPYWLPNSNTGVLNLHLAPLLSITYIRFQGFDGSWITIPPAQYIAESVTPGSVVAGPSRVQPQYGMTWPIPRPVIDCINIRGIFGYGNDSSTVPENVKIAILMLVAHWYENREHVVVGQLPTRLQDTIDSLLAASDHGAYS